MNVLHLTPTFFDKQSVLGGAERYAYELARAMAEITPTRLISYSDSPRTWQDGRLSLELLKRSWASGRDPFGAWSWSLRRRIQEADVIQCYQIRTMLTDWAILWARAYGKKVFVADMGGGARWALSYHIPLDRWVTGFCLLTQDVARDFPHPGKRTVVYGGVDTERFAPRDAAYNPKQILFVGRLIPAKGIEHLIAAVGAQHELCIVGQVLDAAYKETLVRLAQGKRVRFIEKLSDGELAEMYRSSAVTVLPSVDRMEKLGLVLLESMACGTPVIGSRIGGMPELIDEGKNGFTVPAKDSRALAERIAWFEAHPDERAAMGREARQHVVEKFTWKAVAERHLAFYREA